MIGLYLLALTGLVLVARYWVPVNAARRDRRQAAERLRMSEIALEIEKLMRNGKLKKGQLVHDRVYKIVFLVQTDLHKLTWGEILFPLFDKKQRASFRETSRRLEVEINESKLAEPLGEFFSCYYRDFLIARPIRTRCLRFVLLGIVQGCRVLSVLLKINDASKRRVAAGIELATFKHCVGQQSLKAA